MVDMDLNSFWTQTLSAVVAGIVVMLIQPQWIGGFFRRKSDTSRAGLGCGNQNSGGNEISLTGSEVRGGIRQKINNVDNSTRSTHIVNNTLTTSKPSDQDVWGSILVGALICLLSVGLFLVITPVFHAVSIGASGGLVVLTAAAFARSKGQCTSLRWQPIVTVSFVVASVGILWMVWINVLTTTRDSLSLLGIRGSDPEIGKFEGDLTFTDHLSRFMNQTMPSVVDRGIMAVVFLLFLLFGLVVSILLLFAAWKFVTEWHAYLSVQSGTKVGERTGARAGEFVEQKILQRLLLLVVFGGLAFLLSKGYAYDLTTLAQV
jgi:hypothetical protein